MGGIALTSILYFLVVKGARGASFMHPEWIEWIETHTSIILISSFAFFTVIFQALILFFRMNIFPVIILAGTFALAFAFAGNDLVNFVGVPVAAMDSVMLWKAQPGMDPGMMMGGLRDVKVTPRCFRPHYVLNALVL